MSIISIDFLQPRDANEILQKISEHFVNITPLPGEYTSRYLDKIRKIAMSVPTCKESKTKFINSAKRVANRNKPGYELLWRTNEGNVTILVLSLEIRFIIPNPINKFTKTKILSFLHSIEKSDDSEIEIFDDDDF